MNPVNATALYVSASRLVLNYDPGDPQSFTEINKLLPFFRQSLSCCVCGEDLSFVPCTISPHPPGGLSARRCGAALGRAARRVPAAAPLPRPRCHGGRAGFAPVRLPEEAQRQGSSRPVRRGSRREGARRTSLSLWPRSCRCCGASRGAVAAELTWAGRASPAGTGAGGCQLGKVECECSSA